MCKKTIQIPINGNTDGTASALTGAHYCQKHITKPKGGHKEMGIVEIQPLNAYEDGTSRTIKRQYQQSSKANFKRKDSLGATGVQSSYRIRKFTPRECFRLMGVQDADIDKLIASGISNSQLYKLAGNSIVVNCLAAIFRQLLIENSNKNQQLEIF